MTVTQKECFKMGSVETESYSQTTLSIPLDVQNISSDYRKRYLATMMLLYGSFKLKFLNRATSHQ